MTVTQHGDFSSNLIKRYTFLNRLFANVICEDDDRIDVQALDI